MATIEFDDPQYHVEITSTSPVSLVGAPFKNFMTALAQLNTTTVEPQTLTLVSGVNFDYTLTCGGARTYEAKLRQSDRARKVTQTSFFVLKELLLHNPVIETIFDLLDVSVTQIDVTWS